MSLGAPAWLRRAVLEREGSPGIEQRASKHGPNQEIQFVGEQPTYLDLGAFPVDEYGSRLVFQPKSCVGKSIPEDCTPPDRDELVGTSQGPWPAFKLV